MSDKVAHPPFSLFPFSPRAMYNDSLHSIRQRTTAADRAYRNKVQVAHVKQLWYFLASVLFFLTCVRVLRYTWSRLATHPKQSNSTNEKVDEEKNLDTPSTRSSFQRFFAALASGFRILFFRISVPIGPGVIASISELTFTFAYIATMFVWLLTDSKSITLFTHILSEPDLLCEARDLEAFMYQDRAALIASSQLPLVVALAGKNNLISCESSYFFLRIC